MSSVGNSNTGVVACFVQVFQRVSFQHCDCLKLLLVDCFVDISAAKLLLLLTLLAILLNQFDIVSDVAAAACCLSAVGHC